MCSTLNEHAQIHFDLDQRLLKISLLLLFFEELVLCPLSNFIHHIIPGQISLSDRMRTESVTHNTVLVEGDGGDDYNEVRGFFFNLLMLTYFF